MAISMTELPVSLRQALAAMNGQVVSLEPHRQRLLEGLVLDLVRGTDVSDDRIAAALKSDSRPVKLAFSSAPILVPGASGSSGATAIVSFKGVALYNVEWQPYAVSTLRFAQTIKALAADASISTIMIDFDSPGGVVTGTPEAANALFQARSRKRVIALVNPLAASAAYWIAAQASELAVVPSGDVGSIGVYMLHVDQSKMLSDIGIKPTFVFAGDHKVEGNSFEPLGDEARAHLQAEVDATYADFLAAVARGRGKSVAVVREKFGKGRTVSAEDAVSVGMADRIVTPDMVLNPQRDLVNSQKASLVIRERLADLAKDPRSSKEAERIRLLLAIEAAR